jgi:hypothetical protein
LGRVNLMNLINEMPSAEDKPSDWEIRDALVFLALDHRDIANMIAASSELEGVDNMIATFGDSDPAPSKHIMREAIILVAHGKPPGYEAELRRRILHYAHRPPTAKAVESILTGESSDPELRFALRVLLAVHTTEFADPAQVARILDTLLARPSLAEDAMLAPAPHRPSVRPDALWRRRRQAHLPLLRQTGRRGPLRQIRVATAP